MYFEVWAVHVGIVVVSYSNALGSRSSLIFFVHFCWRGLCFWSSIPSPCFSFGVQHHDSIQSRAPGTHTGLSLENTLAPTHCRTTFTPSELPHSLLAPAPTTWLGLTALPASTPNSIQRTCSDAPALIIDHHESHLAEIIRLIIYFSASELPLLGYFRG